MVLNDTDIQNRITSAQLLTDYDVGNIQNCGYVLRAGKVFQPTTGAEEVLNTAVGRRKALVWEIGPSECLVVRTEEKVKMPNDICATYAPLFHLSSQGLMLLNASVVEPGYEGRLSCFLVNFSSQRISLAPSQQVAKITFHQLTAAPGNPRPKRLEDDKYEEMLSVSAKKFHKSFMDVTGIETRAVEKARDAVKKWVLVGGVFVAILSSWAAFEPLLTKWFWEKMGIYSTTQRIEDIKLMKDLESARLKAEIESLKTEFEKLKNEKQLKRK